eukprot:3131844-Heterocapsa_arctica.AAC.1
MADEAEGQVARKAGAGECVGSNLRHGCKDHREAGQQARRLGPAPRGRKSGARVGIHDESRKVASCEEEELSPQRVRGSPYESGQVVHVCGGLGAGGLLEREDDWVVPKAPEKGAGGAPHPEPA